MAGVIIGSTVCLSALGIEGIVYGHKNDGLDQALMHELIVRKLIGRGVAHVVLPGQEGIRPVQHVKDRIAPVGGFIPGGQANRHGVRPAAEAVIGNRRHEDVAGTVRRERGRGIGGK